MGGGPVSPGRRDEVVLITGCSDGGIGAALALAFCEAGFSVVATSRSLDTMTSFEGQTHIETVVLDLTVEETIKEAVESVMSMYGRIDILVNNAGTPCNAPLAEVSKALMEKVYNTNLFGPIMLIQAVVPHMVAKGKGKIVNVGSIGAYAAGPWSGVYSSSKVALHAASDVLRVELMPFNIDVMVLAPGGVNTAFGTKGEELINSFSSSLQLYKTYIPYLQRRAVLSQSPKSTPAAEFAKKAVKAVTKKSLPPYFTYGYLSRIYYFLYYCPSWIRDWYFGNQMPNLVGDKKQA